MTISSVGRRGSQNRPLFKTHLGMDEDLYITADAEAFVKWRAGAGGPIPSECCPGGQRGGSTGGCK